MQRPIISKYEEPVSYLRDMLAYRKQADPGFTVASATQSLRRVSPALVSLVLKKKRTLTLDRAEEFARLMNLNTAEKFFFRNWIGRSDARTPAEAPQSAQAGHNVHHDGRHTETSSQRREPTLLDDWINAYVKDFFQIRQVQKNPELLHRQLMHIATPKRIERALRFLQREGYLRRTLDGRLVQDDKVPVSNTPVPAKKIRDFHKGALMLAKRAIDVFASSERLANTMTITLDQEGYSELMHLIQEFGEKLRDFATHRAGAGDRLYQLIINVSPVGGKIE
jgi:uncharacterized protein (TIGR02147 family)